MKNSHFLIGAVIGFFVVVFSSPADAQLDPPAAPSSTESPTVIQIQGLVTGKKKYSFTVDQDGIEHTIKLADRAAFALKMNRPWFDWKKDRVVVEALPFPAENATANAKPPRRVPFKFPAKKLFLISRFGNEARLNETMSTEVKRINFYLVTPEDPGEHFPTTEKPYLSGVLSGVLSANGESSQVEVDGQVLPVMLGFRYATMNGFSITQLEPGKTQVFLSGVLSPTDDIVTATRVLFQPVTETKKVTSNSIPQPQPVAKQ